MQRTLVALAFVALITALAGCLDSAGETGTGAASPASAGEGAAASQASGRHFVAGDARGLEPAVSRYPAAGVCLAPTRSTRVVSARLDPDTPRPRCLRVHPHQRLRLINATDAYGQPGRTVTVRLESHRARLAPGEAVTFHEPFGAYLAPGDHPVENGPEVLLRDH